MGEGIALEGDEQLAEYIGGLGRNVPSRSEIPIGEVN